MADFELAFEETMKAEGGYVNDPDDPGGETYRGLRAHVIQNGQAGPISTF